MGQGRTHLFYTGTPEFAFGTGLSYSNFDMAWENQNIIWSLGSNAQVIVEIEVTNPGNRPGSQTALLFFRPVNVSNVTHLQKLVAYRGTGVLESGEKARL